MKFERIIDIICVNCEQEVTIAYFSRVLQTLKYKIEITIFFNLSNLIYLPHFTMFNFHEQIWLINLPCSELFEEVFFGKGAANKSKISANSISKYKSQFQITLDNKKILSMSALQLVSCSYENNEQSMFSMFFLLFWILKLFLLNDETI